ncbi:MAG: PqqD family protein, partial [Thermodesulfobacteriota bacterium]
AVIWEMIEGEYTLDDCVKAILEHYDVSLGQAQTDAKVLAEKLFQERLVIISENDAPHKYNPQSPNKPKLSYETPELNIYRDIGELLALDPPIPGLKKINWED